MWDSRWDHNNACSERIISSAGLQEKHFVTKDKCQSVRHCAQTRIMQGSICASTQMFLKH